MPCLPRKHCSGHWTWTNGADRYGCSVPHQGGSSVCENALLVRSDELKESLLKGLADNVLRIEVIYYAVARMQGSLKKGARDAQCRSSKTA